ncbi:hypothetical protein Taro_046965 [Colocasia esculenta]|uniref:non-specific serine/threonine protein kinase n=1 Tax=Colocasia esculenta TaxID=4460 RepID=A0A843WZX4_COLES|nr:hypothetical protein [Colocasia esculenta]
MLSIDRAHTIFSLSLLVPLVAAVSLNFSSFDRETKVTCSPHQKGICLQGDALLNQGLQLTKNHLHTSIASSVGRAVYSQPVRIWDSATGQTTDFRTQFSFIIYDVDPHNPSGDGFAFFLSSYPSVIPNNSADGFLGLFPNSSHGGGHGKMVAVEFDSYPNADLDSNPAAHIGINVNSIRSVVELTLEGGIRKRTMAEACVEYSAKTQALSVTLSYVDASMEGNSSLSHVLDLREVLPEYASIGFSAATGTLVETHTILSWSFDSTLHVKLSVSIHITVMAGAMVVGAVLAWLLMGDWRKTIASKVENFGRYVALPSRKKNEKSNHKDINIDAKHANKRGEGGITEGSGREPAASGTFWSSDMWARTRKSKAVGSDAGTLKQGRGSDVEAPRPMDLSGQWSSKEIPYHALMLATNNFSEEMMLGKGGFGPVYRGFLSDIDLDVAIKKLSEGSEQGVSEYMAEVKIMTQLRHRNLVKLIGWCQEHGELMLVYEFMPNGSLDSHLFKENRLLEWSLRYKIVLGLANALAYLHDECEPYVLHRDIKSSNILLDSKFNAKLADFGLARAFNLDMSSLRVSHPAGTRGYWAPEYALMLKASRRSDVYSFGVVVLEIACGKKAIQMTQGEDGKSTAMLLVEWVWDLYGRGTILDAKDERLSGKFDLLQMERLLVTGLWCAHPDDRQRPSIRQACNALLYPETTPLPALPDKMPPWALPLDRAQMQTAQLSPAASISSTLYTSDAPMSSPPHPQIIRYGYNRDSNTSPLPRLFRKLKRRVSAQLPRWLIKRKKATSFEVLLDSESRTDTGLKEFSYEELVLATDNFSLMLGRRASGSVYRGQLASGMDVAVKKFTDHGQSIKECMTEVMTLSDLVHKNLVKVIGWCLEHGQYLLVYEYMAQGTLDEHLFGDLADSSAIPWEVRYKVVLDLASVLCYLHNDCDQCVLHRDIKPAHLFLDGEFNMKLGGFAFARETGHGLSLPNTGIAGTFGYTAPEYCQSGKYTTASDVYSFGVVALEIACGRRSLQPGSGTHGYGFLMQWVWQCYSNVDLLRASDEKLGGKFDSREMERLLVVGIWCTHYDAARRPRMAKVLRVLQFEAEPPALVHADVFI